MSFIQSLIHLELSYAAPDGAVGRWPQLDLTPGLNRDSTGADLASSQLLSIGNGERRVEVDFIYTSIDVHSHSIHIQKE